MFAEADTSQGFQIIVDTCLFFEITRIHASNVDIFISSCERNYVHS
jgi:hypothetical protein